MNQLQKHKKKEEKGFDALQASFLEKGLVAAQDNRAMGLRAVGQTHSISEKHHSEKQKKHESRFSARTKKEHGEAVGRRLGKYAGLKPVKLKHKHALLPNQLKDKGGSDSSSDSEKKD